jgi:CheY-like chemotaxis protein
MKKRILAIDDSKAIRFLLQTVLGKQHNVVTAPDGCTAMYWLSKRNIPDLIICDPQLPDMKDWELVEELAGSILYRDIPLMVISSLGKAETDAKCEEFGISEYFMNPSTLSFSWIASIDRRARRKLGKQVNTVSI